MVGFVIWIVGLVLTIRAASHRIGGFHQLGRIAVLLFLW